MVEPKWKRHVANDAQAAATILQVRKWLASICHTTSTVGDEQIIICYFCNVAAATVLWTP